MKRGRRGKIDDKVLVRLFVEERLSLRAIAKRFGCQPAAVHKRVRLLGLEPHRRPASTAALAHVEAAQRGAFDIAARLTQFDSILQDELTKLQANGIPEGTRFDRLMQLIGEGRKTCGTAIELSRAIASIQEVGRFRERVLQALDVLPEEHRRAVIDRLRELRQRVVSLTPVSEGAA